MKNLITAIAIIICSITHAQRVFILERPNDTLRFKVQNETPHKFLIIENGKTIFQKEFKGTKTFDIYCKNYLYKKEYDSIHKITALFFDNKSNFSKAQLRKILQNESYSLQYDLINDLLENYQDRDIEVDQEEIRTERNDDRE